MIRTLLFSLIIAPFNAHATDADCKFDSLARFSKGKCITLLSNGVLNQPLEFLLGPKGTIFVSSRDNSSVLAVTGGGVVKSSWTVPGNPLGLALDAKRGILYCATTQRLIAKYSLEGKYLGDLIKFDKPKSQPVSLAISSQGTVYASISYENIVLELSPEGRTIRTIGRGGIAAGEFRFPQRIAVDAKDNLWVAELEGKRIQRIEPNGRAEIVLTDIGRPSSLSVSESMLWFATDAQKVSKYDLRTQKTRAVAQLNSVNDIGVGASGELFFLIGHPIPK